MSKCCKSRLIIGLAVILAAGTAYWAVNRDTVNSTTEVSEEATTEAVDSEFIQPLQLAADAPVDYNFHVKPILSDNCFACHGPDPNTRESGLRLDTFEGATANLAEEGEEALFAVVPGQPEQSEVWKRINYHDSKLVMPPPEANKDTLNEQERSIVRRWIEQGAEYKTHWSFIPPEKPELPEVELSEWAKNEIDHYILSKLEMMGTGPSPMADKETLIRRVSLDLTGLPPTPEEVDAFLADTSPFAYETVVDRLMESPHFGERMALDWMDVSRYGDTNAHHVDLIRTSWPWRDWVIRSFNENKPYDEFIIEQLAGDLLEDPTQQQILATSFNRNHPITNEGGAIDEEYLVEYAADRVHTVSTAFMGLTMACARCHDHKFDPVSIDEYYSFLSFFNSINEVGLESQNAEDAEGYRPYIYIDTSGEGQNVLDENLKALSDIEQSIKEIEWKEDFEKRAEAVKLDWTQLTSAYKHGFLNGEEIKGPNYKYLRLNPSLEQLDAFQQEEGLLEFDISMKDLPDESDFFLLHFTDLKYNLAGPSRDTTQVEGRAIVSEIAFHLVEGSDEAPEVSSELEVIEHWSSDVPLELAEPAAYALDQDPATAWIPEATDRSHIILIRLKEGLPQDEDKRLRLAFHLEEGSLLPVQNNMLRVYASKSGKGIMEMAELVRPFSPVALGPEKAYRYHNDEFALEWAVHSGSKQPSIKKRWAETRDHLYDMRQDAVRVAVMDEKEEPTPTFVLDRGAYDAPLEDRPVDREVPAALGEMDSEYPENRLGLAYWLVDEDNPLTARVTVNRYWQMIFGTGIVRTSEDFGAQGELPTHPELLDYLAVTFIESGWDTKALIRKMVTSATYRQQSVYRPEFKLADPENRYLAWFPRRRLPAEFIRDNALAASGLLVPKIGGPSVKPYQPDGLWREKTMRPDSNTGTFSRDDGEDLYRRGMYTFWKQVAPPPQMEAFDAPSREVCVIQRNTTNTPMQALVLQNDETYLEVSRAMASRLMDELPGEWEPTLEDRLVRGYRYLTGRKPSENSLDVLKNLTKSTYEIFSEDSEKAEGFLSYGESPIDPSADQIELASLAYTASAILNLDKTITRD